MEPLRVFLSHASADKSVVEHFKRILEEGNDIECWLDKFEIGLGENIVSRINDGLSESDLVLFFVSPTSLKSRFVKEEWTSAYWSQANSGKTCLIPVLIGDCKPPAILANKKYCDLRRNQLENLRHLKSDLLRGRRASSAGGSRASLPNFVGREAELAELKEQLAQPGSLVPIIGMPGIGKTYLAREFVRRNGALFEEAVYELNCEGKDLAALTGELSTILGLRPEGDATQVAAELRRYMAGKRCLLFLDNVEDQQPGELVPHGRASVLVTSRNPSIPFLADYPELSPELFTDNECLLVFRKILGAFSEDSARRLFGKLGHLPIAITVSAGLIKHDTRHTVESLEAALPPLEKLSHGTSNVGRLLHQAIAALSETDRQLTTAMAACAPARLSVCCSIGGRATGRRRCDRCSATCLFAIARGRS